MLLPTHIKDAHCSYCGNRFTLEVIDEARYPRTCANPSCAQITYSVPHSVCAVLVPILTASGQLGVLTIRRSIPPKIGELALPGGFIEGVPLRNQRPHRSLQEQAVQEVYEETGIVIDPATMRDLFAVGPTESNAILHFSVSEILEETTLPQFEPNAETSERVIVTEATTLAFTTHTETLAWFLHQLHHHRSSSPIDGPSIWEYSATMRGYRGY